MAATLLYAGRSLWHEQQLPEVRVSHDGSLLSRDFLEDDSGTLPCAFYNASFTYSHGLCSHFSVARTSASVQSEALERALACAARHETDCILSPEVGLSVPAAFVYDQEAGLRMLIAPRLLPPLNESVTKLVEFRHPTTEKGLAQLSLNDTVHVEALEGGTRQMRTETLYGSAAYCVQLLRMAFSPSCWKEID
jgi:hypothetical protein